jgi:leader peptidase (prepilin peptidase) / N-methyltransferase
MSTLPATHVLQPTVPQLIALGALGLAVGWLTATATWRFAWSRSQLVGWAECPGCGQPLAGLDQLPILGWLRLGGRCRACRGQLTWRYPVVESMGALLAVAMALLDGWQPLLAFHLIFAWALLSLAVIDLDTWLLPFAVSIPLIPLAVLSAGVDPERSFTQALAGGAIGWGFLAFMGWFGRIVFKKEAMGGGDAWLLASIGAFTGPVPLIFVMLLASVQGVAFGLVRIYLLPSPSPTPAPEGEPEEEWVPDPRAVPFGPFLALGAIETLLSQRAWLHILHFDLLPLAFL